MLNSIRFRIALVAVPLAFFPGCAGSPAAGDVTDPFDSTATDVGGDSSGGDVSGGDVSDSGPVGAGWCDEVMSAELAAQAGVYEPAAVAQLWQKCQARAAAQFSNTDNMAVVGVMSTHLVWRDLIAATPSTRVPAAIQTVIER